MFKKMYAGLAIAGGIIIASIVLSYIFKEEEEDGNKASLKKDKLPSPYQVIKQQ